MTRSYSPIRSVLPLIALVAMISLSACGGNESERRQTDAEFASSLREKAPIMREEIGGPEVRQFGEQLCAEIEESGSDAILEIAASVGENATTEDEASQSATVVSELVKRYCPELSDEAIVDE